MIVRRRPREGPLIALLLKRLAVFAFVLCLFCVFLYILGTGQGFTDLTQLFLLRLARETGLFLSFAAVLGLFLNLGLLILRRNLLYLPGMGGYAALLLFGGGTAALSAFIAAVAGGNLP
jgi:hypothetical protein